VLSDVSVASTRDWKRGNAPIFRQLRIDDDLLDPHDVKTRAEDAGAELGRSRIDRKEQWFHPRRGRGLKLRDKVRRRRRRRRGRGQRKRRSGMVEERRDVAVLPTIARPVAASEGREEERKKEISVRCSASKRKKRSTKMNPNLRRVRLCFQPTREDRQEESERSERSERRKQAAL
jgi:hypothetical protein